MLHTICFARITRLNYESKPEVVDVQIDRIDPDVVEWDNNTIYFTLYRLAFALPDGLNPDDAEFAAGRLVLEGKLYLPYNREDFLGKIYFTGPLMWTMERAKSERTITYGLARAWMERHSLTEAIMANDRNFYDPGDPRFVILQPVTNFA